jgi:hypothetical protein
METTEPASDDVNRWVSAVIKVAPEMGDDEPLSLRTRPLENWTLLVHGETKTLSGKRASQDLLAQMRAIQTKRSSRKKWIIGAVALVVLAAVAAFMLWHRLHAGR